MLLIFAVAGLTLLGSFLCSLFEAALYALTPSQLEVLKKRGSFGTERFVKLRGQIDEPIAAILTVNTITHTVGAAACGALVGERMGSGAVGVFAAVFTVLVLFFTEIIPKSLGVRKAVFFAPLIAWPLQWMIWITWPVVKLSAWFMRLLGGGHGATPTEEEVVVLSRLAARGGDVRAEEHRWVRNALLLDKVKAKDILTPRTVVQSLSSSTRVEDLGSELPYLVHSRIPVTNADSLDEVVGVVHRRQLQRALIEGNGQETLGDLVRPITMVPESAAAHWLLDEFLRTRQHLFGVVDEYGGFEGVVTLEDVLEALLGREIVDEYDHVEDLREFAREQARKRAAPDADTESV